MPSFRVPYPSDREGRRSALERARQLVERFGRIDGSTEAGTFRGSTPIGAFAGSYRSPEGEPEIEIELTKKPLLIAMGRIESEARKFFSQA